ncbi:hypothetical protein [Amycolatopsis anabasis]|uniref:hypothetical protein n=1 Tax=Amycolatopsis anabasis TaxID=1840409 RepID=UPI00131AD5B7|nr:hypothetical protein [Amycolatopsis anabasis]
MAIALPQRKPRSPLLLADQFAPHYQFERARHRIVDAAPDEVYAAAHALDLAQIRRPLFDVLRRLCVRACPAPLTLDELETRSPWTVLGELPGEEIVFGVAGQFWRPGGDWRRLEPRDFADFAEPGYGKLVVSLSVRPYGRRRSLVTVDVRVLLDDPASWVRFRRIWPLAGPLIGRFQAALLCAVESAALHPHRDLAPAPADLKEIT